MSNFPLIRTAVNICLIAATVIQPMAFVAASGTCAQGLCCQSKMVCGNCQSCEVKLAGDRCGCCDRDTVAVKSCCSNKSSANPKRDQWTAETSDIVSDPRQADAELVEGKAAFSSCRCGIRSIPVAPAPGRVPNPEVRDLVLIAYLDHVALGSILLAHPNATTLRLPINDLSPHFSQRFLCVWRI